MKNLDQVVTELKKADFSAAKWKTLGLKLQLYINTLDGIGMEKSDGTQDFYLVKTIQKWLEKGDDVKETTWKILINAVAEINKAAAEKISDKYS